MVISMLKIRRPLGRLIFNMGIAIPGKTVFLIETAPRSFVVWNPMISSGFPSQRARNAERWCLIGCYPEQVMEENVELPVLWDPITLMWRHCVFWPSALGANTSAAIRMGWLSVWVRLSLFSRLSIIQSMGLCVFLLSSSNRKYVLLSIV